MARLRPAVIVHYHEVSLKRGNRPLFLRHLARNLERAASDVGPVRLRQLSGRILLDLDRNPNPEIVRDRAARVCGVASVALASRVPSSVDAMKDVIGQLLDGRRFAGDPVDLLELNRVALDRLQPDVSRPDRDGNRFEGPIAVDASATVRSSVIIGPAVIGPGSGGAAGASGPGRPREAIQGASRSRRRPARSGMRAATRSPAHWGLHSGSRPRRPCVPGPPCARGTSQARERDAGRPGKGAHAPGARREGVRLR